MTWKNELKKGKSIDKLKEMFRTRAFRAAAKSFIKQSKIDFELDDYDFNLSSSQNQKMLADSKVEFLKTMEEVYDETFQQLGRMRGRITADARAMGSDEF